MPEKSQSTIIIGMTASRFGFSDMQNRRVDEILDFYADFIGIHGDCKGGDEQFDRKCKTRGKIRWAYPGFPAGRTNDFRWRAWCDCEKIFEPRPFMVRNRHIVEACDLLIGCPQNGSPSSGTNLTIKLAKQLRKNHVVIDRQGLARWLIHDTCLSLPTPLVNPTDRVELRTITVELRTQIGEM